MQRIIGFLALLVLAVVFLNSSAPIYANTAPPAQVDAVQLATAVTLTPNADAYVDSTYPSTNYGASTQVRVDGSPVVNSYIRFSVSGLTGGISNATLRIYANSSLSTGYAVHAVSNNTWSESTIAYGNAPAMGTTLGQPAAITATTWTSVDVTSFVTGNGTFTFGITDPTTTALSLASRESTYAPQLVVTPSTSATPIPTATTAPATATQVPPTATSVAPTATKVPPTATSIPPSATPGGVATTVTVNPNADAYVDATYPSTNYGTLTSLRTDGSPIVNSYLRFSVSTLSGAVSKATLRIYANSSLSVGYVLHAVSNNTWSETTITSGNAPAMGATLGQPAAITAATWTSVDVTSFVTGNGTFTFGITDPSATALSLASRESANPPQLVITTGSGTLPTATPVLPTATTVASSPTPTKAATNTPAPVATATPVNTPGTVGTLPVFSHIYTIVMENTEYSSIVGSSSAPYINSLIAQYGLATNYNANYHPSEPNYIAMFSGSPNGVTDDGVYNLSAKNVADQMDAKGKTWKMYAQNVPLNCYTGSTASGGEDGTGNYARKHEPAISFTNISGNASRCANITDFTHFDPAAANYEFIVPNLCNDMHDCSISTGDNFLKGFVPKILNSAAWQNGGVLFLTWDEGSSGTGGGGHIATVVIAPNVPAGFKSSTAHNEYSYLRTIQDSWGLGCLANTCNANNMAEFFH